MTQNGIPDAVQHRKPRLALMGEFSAGKSTLTNLLVGRAPLPVRVTATRLPPVWISHGAEAASIVAHDGSETPIAIDDLDAVDLDTTALIRLSLPAEALELCDLIDMPGISDPNMPASVWQSLLPEVDSVIWCTHATQAWRQSEAAAWQSLHEGLNGPSTLLITHFDKLQNTRDRARVQKRVAKETQGMFDAIYPVSLTQALAAGDDMEVWKSSGADGFVEHLIELLVTWEAPDTRQAVPAQNSVSAQAARPAETPAAKVLEIEARRDATAQPAPDAAPAADAAGRVVPRRVKTEKRSQRPPQRQRDAELESPNNAG